ncbi:preprotein translocase subunit SecD [Halomicrobium zhouii]|uniref:Protein-export membrane protein SecD n=1 Tax=Halomicrobium zhouii TaxID=767519 RepID=A0A1I6KLS7_9EURY|nr:preprotein translocase subunit SecD [Halomicrobium zhouii]SFR92167.1 preprotein translocase subunit SecD [Halomicrobium zhouii]
MTAIRDNWRIVLLVFLLVASAVVLFVPGATAGGGANETEAPTGTNVSADERDSGWTNLQYGIQLDGGSRIRAPIVGNTTENVNITSFNESDSLETTLAQRFEIDRLDVEVTPNERNEPDSGTVEVYSRNVSQSELLTALQDEGYDVSESDVRNGVTQSTRDEMVSVIDEKLQVSALTGADVREARTPTGENYIVIEATGRDIGELREILDDRGIVRQYVLYQAQNGSVVREEVLTQEDFDDIGSVRQDQAGRYSVSVTLSDSAAGPFMQAMQTHGYTQGTRCGVDTQSSTPPEEQLSAGDRCLLTTLNGEPVFAAGVQPNLASSFRDDTFVNDPSMSMTAPDRDRARNLELSLKVGAPLPAPLDFADAQTTSLQPSLGDEYKTNSVITGLIAVIAVSGAVYTRYRDPRVAAPMVVTALSEVVILLGFVSLVQFPIDLSHIAGFIAVIGTGVDDLIIIADEILQEKGVATGRVFQNRFRKAFWVIGAAAATTIIAMSPLMVLSLGDLTGFAIVTIVGVLIGVLVTRPAYGDILRHLVLSEDER